MNELEQNPAISWLGGLHPVKVKSVLDLASAHVLPSKQENFGLTTVEALAAGCPAVVPSHHFSVSALGSAVVTYRHPDRGSLLSAVEQAFTRPPPVNRRLLKKFDPMVVAQQLVDFYRSFPSTAC